MSIAVELSTKYDEIHRTAGPSISAALKKATTDHKNSFDPSKAIQVGDKFPEFQLSDAKGEQVSLQDLLRRGPLLISFYRGQWCPYCNIELHALQKLLPEFKAKGVTLVAISPELPDQALSTAEQNGLEFPVLSDVGNKLAKQLGIVYAQPEDMSSLLTFVDWEKSYGNKSFEVPVPATILVDGKGIVRNTFVEAAWHVRLDPSTTLQWIKEL